MNQQNDCLEVAPHIAAKGKMPRTDEKPPVQVMNELLTDDSPTGYAHHREPECIGSSEFLVGPQDPEARARILYDKQKQNDALQASLDEANAKIAELQGNDISVPVAEPVPKSLV